MATTSARTLSRDFKGVRRHSPVALGQAFTGWVGFGAGLGLGLAVAVAVHLYDGRQGAVANVEPMPATAPAPASEKVADESAMPVQDNSPPELDFYDMLPRQEVAIPEKTRGASTATAGTHTPLPAGGVLLQAGSFKQSTEAEKMQAQLALLGISDARIQRASVDDETWYRVRIGPIATVEDLHIVQAKLREAEISASIVTSGDAVPLP
jgi:cell division protein FtsN